MATVKVRVAVVVTTEGRWDSCGCSGWSDEKKMAEAETMIENEELEGCNRFILEAELPIPEAKEPSTVQATVVEA